MKLFGSPNNSWQSTILSIGVFTAAVLVIAFSLIEILSLSNSVSRVVVLVATIFVASLVSRYELKIPRTQIGFSPKDIFAFWAVIWFGISAGVLIAVCASLANSRASSAVDRKRLTRDVAADALATFFAAIAFYVSIGYFQAGRSFIFAAGLTVPSEIAIASCVMAATHFAHGRAIRYLIRNVYHHNSAKLDAVRFFAIPAAATLASLVATIFLFSVFNHFGIEFGLTFIPLAIIGHLSYKIHVSRLQHKTRQITEASRIHLATVEALATAIDAREQVGIGHVRRTQIYAVGIGNILGLGEDEINAIRTGALLHDIGKLAVPDHILNKPGRLTPAEMEKTKTHSLVGASILEKVGFPYPVVPTVKYHHEFWNGAGYPDGLRGTNIPLTARILSIADAYDTLRVARPYRNAVPRDEACTFLRSRAGTQFDPKLVNVFLQNLKIFEAEIKAQQLGYESDLEAVSVSGVIEAGASPNYVEQIKRANREVFTLYSLARDFSSALDLEEILSLFTKKVGDLVPFDTTVVYLLEESGEFAQAAYVEGRNKAALTGGRVRIGEGPTGDVLLKCRPIEDVQPALDFAFSHAELGKEYCAMAAIPLVADERTIGALSLYTNQIPRYQDEDLRLLETISHIAAEAISKSLEHAVTENYALTDPMTGLPNARSLQLHFDKEVARASRSEGSFQVLVLDLDGFKIVNDTYGHKAGDDMLKEIGGVIKSQLREYDFLARYGGDEFIAIIPDTDSTDVLELVRRIEVAVQAFTLALGKEGVAKVGVSIGTACYPIHGNTFDQVVTSADKAMYLTKSFHRKRTDETALVSKNEQGHNENISRPVIEAVPPEISEFAHVRGVLKDGLILEVDETHVVTSSAVN
jgi:diguanylate cyclase (GGDEF)-like protein/putative nucleotidyltransferase with HDIG domain